MDFLPYQEAMYHPAFSHQPLPQYSQEQLHYLEQQHRAQMYMPRRSVSLDGLRQAMVAQGEKGETKARLAKDQVEILEAKFQENNKPNSQIKRLLAQDFGVEQARINNWFQNRRAKAKQDRKQMEHDAQKEGEAPYQDDSASPEAYKSDMFDEGYDSVAIGEMVEMPILNGPPAPASSFSPQYDNASTASMQSFARTLSIAQDALVRGDFDDYDASSNTPHFHGFDLDSTAPFPVTTQSNFSPPMMPTDSSVAINAQQVLAAQSGNGYFGGMTINRNVNVPSSEQPFPSQLLGNGMNNGFPAQDYQSRALVPSSSQSASGTSSPGSVDAGFALNSIPGPSNIASRRAKQRPANLGVDALRSQGLMGARSYSSSDIPHRLGQQSPVGSPMRRVNSNQLGMNVLSGRVQKINNLPLRSPMSKSFNSNCENYFRDMPQTAGAAFNREFPPTPNSPYDKQMMPTTRSSSTSSPLDTSFIFNGGNFEAAEHGSTMASPPETPHNPIVSNHWSFEALDQPLQTPQFDMFPTEMHLQMPPFVSPVSASQPNTPAFGNFSGFPIHEQFDQNLEFMFPGDDMSSYTHSISTKSSPMSLQKTFTFNNVTQESLKEQQRKTEEREKTPVKAVRA